MPNQTTAEGNGMQPSGPPGGRRRVPISIGPLFAGKSSCPFAGNEGLTLPAQLSRSQCNPFGSDCAGALQDPAAMPLWCPAFRPDGLDTPTAPSRQAAGPWARSAPTSVPG